MIPNTQHQSCTLYLVRHGETEWNVDGTVMGQSDSPLTPKGLEQAKTKSELLKKIHFDVIFSSDLPCALKTAELLKRDRNVEIQTSMRLREMGYGSFEGKHFSLMLEALKTQIEKREQLPDQEYMSFQIRPDIETYQALIDRFTGELNEIARTHLGKTVLVVTHGGCIRTFLSKMGYVSIKDTVPGSFSNEGHVKVLSDGMNFSIQEVQGLKSKPIGKEWL